MGSQDKPFFWSKNPNTMIKTAADKMEDACAYYETGKSLRDCEKMTGVCYKSIHREVKKRGLEKGSLSQLVTDKARVEAQMFTISVPTQNIVEKEALIKQKHILFFNNAAILNVRQAMAEPCTRQADYRSRAETINKGRETVLGRSPEAAVQINNSISLEELLRDL